MTVNVDISIGGELILRSLLKFLVLHHIGKSDIIVVSVVFLFVVVCLTMSDNNPGAEHGVPPPSDGGSTPTRVPTIVGIDRNPVQLAQVIGGQYIITSQPQNVPPLTQVIKQN